MAVLCWLCCAAGVCESSLVVCAHEQVRMIVGAGWKRDIWHFQESVVSGPCFVWTPLRQSRRSKCPRVKIHLFVCFRVDKIWSAASQLRIWAVICIALVCRHRLEGRGGYILIRSSHSCHDGTRTLENDWQRAGRAASSQQPAPPPAGGTGRWHVRAATVPPPPLPLFSTPRTRHFRWRFGEHNITWNFHKVNLNPFLSESNTNKLLILLNN